jgi:hypothetical protein
MFGQKRLWLWYWQLEIKILSHIGNIKSRHLLEFIIYLAILDWHFLSAFSMTECHDWKYFFSWLSCRDNCAICDISNLRRMCSISYKSGILYTFVYSPTNRSSQMFCNYILIQTLEPEHTTYLKDKSLRNMKRFCRAKTKKLFVDLEKTLSGLSVIGSWDARACPPADIYWDSSFLSILK